MHFASYLLLGWLLGASRNVKLVGRQKVDFEQLFLLLFLKVFCSGLRIVWQLHFDSEIRPEKRNSATLIL